MARRRNAVPLLLLLLLTLTACGDNRETAGLAPPEEGRLTVYTSHKEEVYGPIVKEFQARTGIWVEVVTGGTNELLERIAAGEDCDVMFGGGVESLKSYADCFEPYACSGANAVKSWLQPEEDLWTPFSSLPVVLIYNTRLVSPGEVTGWADLLDETWRGRIAFADPAVSGSSYTAAVTMLACLPGEDWAELERFAANLDGGVLAGSGDVVEAVSVGSCALGVTLEETALKRQAAGANIAIVYPAEGTSNLPDAAALIQNAPHRDNALVFLEFTQSEDVQALVTGEFFRRSVRSDVPDPDTLPPEDTLRLIDYDITAAAAMKTDFLKRWAQLTEEETP